MAAKQAAEKAAEIEIDGIEVVSEVQRMELKPGDVLVIKSEQRIRAEFRVYLQKQFRRLFPENRVVVIDGGIELQVLAEDEAAG